MNQRRFNSLIVQSVVAAAVACAVFAQQPAPEGAAKKGKGPGRPGMIFRADWNQPKGESPVTQESVKNANLELKLYGPAAAQVQVVGTAGDETNPPHVWTGLCEQVCAVAVRDKNGYMDLSGLGRVRWEYKVAGFHQMRPIVKLADGTWLVGDHAETMSNDWLVSEFTPSQLRWRRLDIKKVVEAPVATFVKDPDLTKVDEFGMTDLMPGSGHGPGGWSDLAWFEIYGKSVPRD